MQAPVRRSSLQEDATGWIRRAIVHGTLAPGETLTEIALTRSVGVGRGTVRAALFALESQGLVSRNPYSSWQVAHLDEFEIWEIYTLRAVFERFAAKIFVEHRGQRHLERLNERFDILRAAENGDTDARVAADLGYHAAIVTETGHRHLIKSHEALANKVEWLYRWSERHWPCRSGLVAEHEPFHRALSSGSTDAAEQAVQEHIDRSISLDTAGLRSLAPAMRYDDTADGHGERA